MPPAMGGVDLEVYMYMPPWTYSRLEVFETCPRQFYEVKVACNFVDPPTEHTVWGKKVHSAMEARLKEGTPLPNGMTQWEGIVSKVDAMPGTKFTEYKFSISRDFQSAEWDKSWSRGIADVLVVGKKEAAVLDWKTGKRKPSNQLHLYSLYVFATFPEINCVKTGFIWLKEKKVDVGVFLRDETHILWPPLLSRVRRMELAYENDKWPAKPSGLCNGWCPVTTCEYNKKPARS